MENTNTNANKNGRVKKYKRFSFKNGFIFFFKAHILIASALILFLINYNQWGNDGLDGITVFVLFAEPFLIAISIVACLGANSVGRKSKFVRSSSKNEWIGFGITFTFLSLFSLGFTGINISFPSTLVSLTLVTNFMVALYSIIFHPIALRIYEYNVFEEKTTVMDYIFKYIAVFLSGINYYVQQKLLNLPLILNKILAILFTLFLLWQWFTVVGLFG